MQIGNQQINLQGLGRYGTALTFILYLLYNETTRDDPSPLRAVIFISLALIVILAKYLAVKHGVKDDPSSADSISPPRDESRL